MRRLQAVPPRADDVPERGGHRGEAQQSGEGSETKLNETVVNKETTSLSGEGDMIEESAMATCSWRKEMGVAQRRPFVNTHPLAVARGRNGRSQVDCTDAWPHGSHASITRRSHLAVAALPVDRVLLGRVL